MKETYGSKERTEFRKQPIWQLLRKFLLNKYDCTCQFCGKQYKDISHLNIHHKYETQYENLAQDRFIVLCRTCHEFIHAKYNAPAFKDRHYYGLRD